jgi:hypothetical protein
MSTALKVKPMAKRETMPVRLGLDAMAAARTAATWKGETLSAYATRVLLESANRDLDEFARARVQGPITRQKGGGK